MEIRIERIISYLCQYSDYQSGKSIADYCGISERTLYRLIPHVFTWLSRQGWALKSKTRKGYKIIGDRDIILSLLKDEKYKYLTLTKSERQNMIILYLTINNSTTGIADLARLLYTSDTSITNDFSEIAHKLEPYHLKITREKGIGVKIEGEEYALRNCFISSFTQLVSPDIFIQYLNPDMSDFSFVEKKINQCFMILNIDDDLLKLKKNINSLERSLGYFFSYSGFATFILYLIITKRRFGIENKTWRQFDLDIHQDYITLASSLFENIVQDSPNNNIAREEISALAIMISAMEIGDITEMVFDKYFSKNRDVFYNILEATLSRIEKLTGYFLKFDTQLKNSFIASLSALISRSRYKIPIWHESWLKYRKANIIENEFSVSIISQIHEYFNVELTSEELQNLQFSFSAIFEDAKKTKISKIRTCIVCFEGIGLANYIKSRLLKIFPDLYIVDLLPYHRIDKDFVEDNFIDLIITTYALPSFDTPVFKIELPFDEEATLDSLSNVIVGIKANNKYKNSFDERIEITKKEIPEVVPVDILLHLIEHFFCIKYQNVNDIHGVLKLVIDNFDIPKKKKSQLFDDFMKREMLGDLVFKEWGVRVLHCRSQSLDKPIAGVVQQEQVTDIDNEYNCILIMAAPSRAEKRTLKGLSSLITALSDERAFAPILAHGSLEAIKSFLFWMYGNYYIHF